MALTLTREIRFGLHENAADSAVSSRAVNSYAANPALTGIAPFLTLRATIAGTVDAATGMMVNTKEVDKVLRAHAVPVLREAHYGMRRPAATIMRDLLDRVAAKFAPHELIRLRLAVSPYLAFEIARKEPVVVEMALKFEFSAAHRLHAAGLSDQENAKVFGRCNNAHGHGHNYEVEVVVAGVPDPHSGMVTPVGALQQTVNAHIIEPFDHKHLNLDCPEFAPRGGLNPTVENIAMVLYRRLAPHIPAPARLAALRVWETPKTMCEYRE